jgi:hypothetical protein
VTSVPERTSITIGYSDDSLLGRVALVQAEAAGYLRDAGFTDVRTMQLEEPLPGLLNGTLDLAILDARQAIEAHASGLPIQAVAGHRVAPLAERALPSPSADASSSPWDAPASPWVAVDLVAATTETVTTRPGTVVAFTLAYVRALQDLEMALSPIGPGASATPQASGLLPTAPAGSPGVSDPILAAAITAGTPVGADDIAAWPASLAAFAPFDGGFDDPTIGDGLGSLRNVVLDDPSALSDPRALVAEATLHAAQAALGISPDPPVVVVASPSPSASPAA